MSKDNYLEGIAEKIELCRDKYPDGMREYQKRYYQENKEKRRAYMKAYMKAYRERKKKENEQR